MTGHPEDCSPRSAAVEEATEPALAGAGAMTATVHRVTRQEHDMSYTVTLDTGGPADPLHVLEVAEAFAECVRVMNHLTGHHEALEYPAEADALLGYLATAASRLPQLLEQVSEWYGQEQEAGRIRIPDGGGWRSGWGDPATAITAARRKLEGARMAAAELGEALDAAMQVTSNLAADVPR